jgi:peptidoglycan/LPS O-acetylase OafA/YrhL
MSEAPITTAAGTATAAGPDVGAPPARPTVAAGRPRFAGMDGLRALAAVAVLAHHVGFDTATTFRSSAGDYLARMDIGVSIFFALSGFLLFRPYVEALVDGTPSLAAREFWRRRVLRIVPAYWVALTFIVLAFGRTMHSLRDVVTFYGLLQIYDRQRFLGGMVQAWSLCTEVSFYAFLPLFALALRRWLRGRRPEARLPALLGAVVGLYAVGVLWRVCLYAFDPSFESNGLFWLPGQIDHFAIGMGLAVGSVWAVHDPSVGRRTVAAVRRPGLWWLGAGVAFWAVSTRLDVPKGLAVIPAGTDLGRQFLYGVVAFGLLVPSVFDPDGPGFVRRFVRHPVMAWLGAMSYGIYLWHKDLVPKVQLLFGWANFEGNWFVVFLGVLLAATAIAAASHYLVEQPILAFKQTGRRRPATVWTGMFDERPAPAVSPAAARWTFGRGLALVTVVGLAIRVAYLAFSRHGIYDCPPDAVLGCAGDAYVYHTGANLIAHGHGFVSPLGLLSGNRFPGADHPPLYWLYLAAWSVLGLDGYGWHQIATLLVGVGSVVVAGFLGREIAGVRAGWAAATAVAVDPFVWVNDALVLSEGLTVFTVLVFTWAAYRCWRRPTLAAAAWLGLAGAAAAMTRAEVALVFPFVVLPLLWRRWRALVVTAAVALAVVAPWLVRNQIRFEEPVGLSTGLGVTMAYANCDEVYSGPLLGFWWYDCKGDVDLQAQADQSVVDADLRHQAVDYIDAHRSRVPTVVAARIGRTWNLYKPNQVTYLDTLEGRPLWVNRMGLVVYYPTMALAAVGVVALRRRRVPILPLLVPLGIVTFAVAITFGQTRYRATAEGPIAVAAALGALQVWDVARARWAARPASQPRQPSPPSMP